MKKLRNDSALRYILEGLIPYTEANLLVAFKPKNFFDELDKRSFRSRQTWRNAYVKARRKGLIELNDKGTPLLTEKGRRKLKPLQPVKLSKGAKLMVIFDIPEEERHKRSRLRLLLRELSFKQVQKSVWVSDMDGREYIREEVSEYKLEKYVRVYEVNKIQLKK